MLTFSGNVASLELIDLFNYLLLNSQVNCFSIWGRRLSILAGLILPNLKNFASIWNAI